MKLDPSTLCGAFLIRNHAGAVWMPLAGPFVDRLDARHGFWSGPLSAVSEIPRPPKGAVWMLRPLLGRVFGEKITGALPPARAWSKDELTELVEILVREEIASRHRFWPRSQSAIPRRNRCQIILICALKTRQWDFLVGLRPNVAFRSNHWERRCPTLPRPSW